MDTEAQGALTDAWIQKVANLVTLSFKIITKRTIGQLDPKKTNLNRREGKGRRCCLADRIYSIPCSASYFAPGRFEDYR